MAMWIPDRAAWVLGAWRVHCALALDTWLSHGPIIEGGGGGVVAMVN